MPQLTFFSRLWLRGRCWQSRSWFFARAHEKVDPTVAEVVLDIVVETFWALELVGDTTNASEVDLGALLARWQIRAIGLSSTLVFG